MMQVPSNANAMNAIRLLAWYASRMKYIVSAMFAVTLRLRSTVRNLPNPPVGERIALKRVPSSSDVLEREALDHGWVRGAEMVKVASCNEMLHVIAATTTAAHLDHKYKHIYRQQFRI